MCLYVMSAQTKKPLIDLPESELKAMLRNDAEHVMHSYNGIVAEIDRRAANRATGASLSISLLSLAISVAALIVAASHK